MSVYKKFFAVSLLTLLVAGCASAPTGSSKAQTSKSENEYCVKMVTNSGGLEDRSFNQSTWEGLEAAEDELDIDADALVSNEETDLNPNVEAAVESGCEMVVTVGWELSDATLEYAKSNPETNFVIVDEVVEADNVKPMIFDTAQASFLAGYLAAGVSKTGKVATFGGGVQPPVTLFMDGFVAGVAEYNKRHNTQVVALGWDAQKQDGAFTGDFEDINKGKVMAQGFIDQGADVILPVAGQVGEGAAAAAVDNGNVLIIWVDNDGYKTLPDEYNSIILSSVMKNTGDAIQKIVADDLNGNFSNDSFIGTLENGGVALAPFHEQELLVSKELSAELDSVKADIIAGKIIISSPSSPK